MGWRCCSAPGRAARLAWALAAASCTVAASAAELPSEADFFAAIPSVQSATRLDQTRSETPAAVSIIDRAMIEASTAVEIPDLLRLVPGFQVAHANGNILAATYHGHADQIPRWLEVMVDGRSVYLPTVSAVEWSTLGLAIEDIERIEVVRSPNATTYGSNAVRGSINIVTRQPYFLRGPYARATVGQRDTGIGVLRYGGRLGAMDAALTLQYRRDDGFHGVDDAKDISDARFHASYQSAAGDSWDIQLGFTDAEVGVGGDGSMFEPFRDRDLRSNYQMLSWQKVPNPNHQYRVQLSRLAHVHDDLFAAPSLANPGETFTFGYYDADIERYDLEFEHRLTPADGVRLVWGAGVRHDRLRAKVMLGERGEVSELSWRLFLNAEWRPLSDVIVNAGAMANYREVSPTYLSPRLGVNWQLSPQQTLRASVSRSHYVGTLLQQYLAYDLVDTAGTVVPFMVSQGPGLKAEDLTAYEVGYLHRWPRHGVELDLKLFREELRNEGFAEAQLPPGRLPIVWGDAAGRATTKGAEAELRYRARGGLDLSLAYSYATLVARAPTNVDAAGNPVGFERHDDTVPRHSLAVQATQRFGTDWLATLALFHLDDMRWRGEGGDLEAYTRIDAKLSRRWRIAGTRLGLSLIAQNLLDEPYQEFREENTFERRWLLQLSLEQ